MDLTTIIMMEILLGLSYVVFYYVYKKLGMTKWINRKWSRATIAFSATFLACIIGVVIMSNFVTDQKLQFIYGGAFLGISVGMIPHIYLSFKAR